MVHPTLRQPVGNLLVSVEVFQQVTQTGLSSGLDANNKKTAGKVGHSPVIGL